jgi:hypothetical protein
MIAVHFPDPIQQYWEARYRQETLLREAETRRLLSHRNGGYLKLWDRIQNYLFCRKAMPCLRSALETFLKEHAEWRSGFFGPIFLRNHLAPALRRGPVGAEALVELWSRHLDLGIEAQAGSQARMVKAAQEFLSLLAQERSLPWHHP